MYRVFAVVLNWNAPDVTRECVDSLRATSSNLTEIVVVDNGSDTDLFRRLSNTLDDLKILRNPENLGYAGGLQIGVDYCLSKDADLIWILNNDTSFSDSTLDELLFCVERNGMDFIYAPKILKMSEPAQVLFNGRVFDFKIAGYRNVRESDSRIFGKFDSDLITEAVSGASFMVPVDVIRQHGFMSHDYYLYYEEFDYALRMREFGIRCICAQSSVMYHQREGTTARLGANLQEVRNYYRTRNRIVFFRRRFARIVALKCTLTFIRQTLRRIADEDRAVKRVYLLALWHGLIGRTGKVLMP